MRSTKFVGRRLVPAAVLMGLAISVTWTVGEAQVKKGKSRAAETKYLMRGAIQPNCAGIGKLLKDSGPADDKAWDDVACHASVLNELSFAVMDDGRCPDKTWADAAKVLRETSSKVLDAAKAKKLDDANASFKELTSACGACHKAHKK
jgi:cytochrome c556